MITENMDVAKFKRIIRNHGCDVDRLSNMSTIKDTWKVAYVLGITVSRKKKRQLWEEIVKKTKEEE